MESILAHNTIAAQSFLNQQNGVFTLVNQLELNGFQKQQLREFSDKELRLCQH